MSEKTIGIGLIGLGTVGGGVATLLREQAALYQRRLGATPVVRKVLVRDAQKAVAAHPGEAALVTTDAEAFFATADMPIVVEVAGGKGSVSQYVRRAIESGRHVVTANKALLAAEGVELFALARRHGVAMAFEAAVCGGIPVITALQFGLMANRIEGLYGILNGTCNYILTEMTRKHKPYAVALQEAQAQGFAEADPTLDVSGRDAAEKLSILASLAYGMNIAGGDVGCEGIDQLQLDDIRFGAELGYDIKLLGISEQWPGEAAVSANVQPCFIHKTDLIAQVSGAFNALLVRGHATGPTMYYGRGAGRLPTASAVVSDILNVASGWHAQAFASLQLTPDRSEPCRLVPTDDLWSRFYLRVNAMDRPGTMAQITAALGERGISLSAVLQHEVNQGQFVPVVVTTHQARRGDVAAALAHIGSLDVICGKPVMIRIVDLPHA